MQKVLLAVTLRRGFQVFLIFYYYYSRINSLHISHVNHSKLTEQPNIYLIKIGFFEDIQIAKGSSIPAWCYYGQKQGVR